MMKNVGGIILFCMAFGSVALQGLCQQSAALPADVLFAPFPEAGMSKSGVLTVPSLSEVTREYELNRLRLVMDAGESDGFLFDRNLYSYDYAAGAVVASWDAGLVAASASYATYPGLMSVESGVLSVTYDFGKVVLTGNVMAEKYRTFRGLDTNYGVGGMLTYRIGERFSLNVFGQYYKKSLYYSPAALPYIGTSKYGVYADMQFGERFGMDLGVSREYDAYSRRWQTVPIAAPYVKLNNGAKIGLDVGRLLGVMIDNWVNGSRYNDSRNPTMPPLLPPMPPVR